MKLMSKVVERINQWRFNRAVRAIRGTPPVCIARNDRVIALSMVQHRDVDAYLLAIKSFLRYMPVSRVVVVADPTLNTADRAIFTKHVPAIEFREAAEFRKPGIPTGGCWERLCAVSEYVAEGYVIQLDADTVAVASLDEIAEAVASAMPFTLGTEDRQHIQTCREISTWARKRLTDGEHVQVIAESLLDKIEGADELRYVRGCAGFAGYPQGSFTFDHLKSLSERMAKIMGTRWTQWGTEQFTSNLLLASMPTFRLLPHPKYCAPHRRKDDTVFMHFIGYVRYTTPLYATLARRVVGELSQSA